MEHRKLKLKKCRYEDYKIDDIKRIRKIFKSHGYHLSKRNAHDAWSMHSEACCAGWLVLPEDDNDVYGILYSYLV